VPIKKVVANPKSKKTDKPKVIKKITAALACLDLVEACGRSISEKQRLLSAHSNNPALRNVFLLTYDWSHTFGFLPTDSQLVSTNTNSGGPASRWKEFKSILDALSTRKLTGNAAKTRVLKFLRSVSKTEAKWYVRILARDLRIGVNVKTIAKVWPGLLNTYQVQLAKTYPDTHPTQFPVAVEPKLDGYRFTIVVEDGRAAALSRNGREYANLAFLAAQFATVCRNGVFDGEVKADSGWNNTSKLLRTVILTHKQVEEINKIKFWVFDYIPLKDFKAGVSSLTDAQRRERLKGYCGRIDKLGYKNVVLVPRLVAKDQGDLEALLGEYVSRGFEGIMIKDPDAKYEVALHRDGRTPYWLKYKPFEQVDATIVSLVPGTGKNKNRLGAFIVRYENGDEARVGTGFTDKQRDKYWEAGDDLIGKLVEIKRQRDVGDSVAIVRFPVFIRIRDAREE
jgi:DNA ligase-1